MPDLAAIQAKLDKGEALTAEEHKEVMSSPPEGTTPAPDPEDPIDWSKAEQTDPSKKKDKPAGEQTPEEVAAKKKADDDAAAAKKKADEEAAAAKKKEEEDLGAPQVDMEKIEGELAKEEGKEDIKDFTKREKAYFHSMRRDRKARQQAEADRDVALRKLALVPKPAAPAAPAAEEDPLKELREKDPTDYVSIAEVIKIVEGVAKKTPAAPVAAAAPGTQGITPAGMNFLKLCDDAARGAHPEDYDAVMELSPDLIDINPSHLKEIERRTVAGENPAEVTYGLIKGDPEFAKLFPVAKTKVAARKGKDKKPAAAPPAKSAADIEKERKAKEAQDALEANKDKPKTSGHASGDGTARDESGKYTDGKRTWTADELAKMSDLEYAKVPKKVRTAFLEDVSK